MQPGNAPGEDDALTLETYERTAEQSEALGLSTGADAGPAAERDTDAAQPSSLEQVVKFSSILLQSPL